VSLAVVLGMVGTKMLAASWLKATIGPNFNFYLLGAVLLTLAVGVVASMVANRRDAGRGPAPGDLSGTHV
jgi:predicted tellurium resistance membrane protein TerC